MKSCELVKYVADCLDVMSEGEENVGHKLRHFECGSCLRCLAGASATELLRLLRYLGRFVSTRVTSFATHVVSL